MEITNSDLQLDLQEAGFDPGPINGQFDATTVAALTSFQKKAGVVPAELGALGPGTATAIALRLGGADDEVEALQSALTDVGAFHDLIDGVYSTTTLGAIKRLQSATGLNIDGFYDAQTARLFASVYSQQVKEPAASSATPASDAALQMGSTGEAVRALQQRLAALGYRPGTHPGLFDAETASAVLAFQKRNGLVPNGIATQSTLAALRNPSGAGPPQSGSGPRIDVDLTRQLMFVTLPSQPLTTLNASTGKELPYTVANGSTDFAYTPTGTFTVTRKLMGEVAAPIGSLYDPLFFDQGWAIEGAAVVPAYRASYGSVRISISDAVWLFSLIAAGTPVVVYGSSGPSEAGAAPGY